jgi:putative aldouronate transport system permease protein
MMVPGIIYLLVNNYMPMSGLILAFKRFNYSLGIWQSPWVGLSNFTYLFTGNEALQIIRNTICYNLVFIVLGTILAITVAILLNDVRNVKIKKTYQTLILIPYLISIVIVSYIVFAFLSQDSGFVNNTLLKALGRKDSISWYTSPKYWPVILTFVYLWKSFGYNSIIYYATIIGIDETYFEAARIDGATRWQQVWYITLQCLKPTIITLTLLSIGRVFYSDFGLFYQVPMDSGPLLNATNTIDTYVYRALLTLNDVGRSSAAGFMQSVMGFIVVFSANLLVNKIDKDNALF